MKHTSLLPTVLAITVLIFSTTCTQKEQAKELRKETETRGEALAL